MEVLDLGWFGHAAFNAAFFSALFSIILINLILSGDNAVVIAMAVRTAIWVAIAIVASRCMPGETPAT